MVCSFKNSISATGKNTGKYFQQKCIQHKTILILPLKTFSELLPIVQIRQYKILWKFSVPVTNNNNKKKHWDNDFWKTYENTASFYKQEGTPVPINKKHLNYHCHCSLRRQTFFWLSLVSAETSKRVTLFSLIQKFRELCTVIHIWSVNMSRCCVSPL